MNERYEVPEFREPDPNPPDDEMELEDTVANLERRVRDVELTLARFLSAVENANSYQVDYGQRIVNLETADRLTHARMNSLCQEQNDLEQRLRDGEFDYCSERLTALEAKQDDTEAVIKSRVVSFANATAQGAKPKPFTVCKNCGEQWHEHIEHTNIDGEG